MAECVNHPGKEGLYRCAKCKKHFCLACIELIDDKAYCYDCLKEIVKEVREEKNKSLTLMVIVASLIAILVAIIGLYVSYGLLRYIPGYVYSLSRGLHEPFNTELLSSLPSLIIGVAFLILGVGLATTQKWSYVYGVVICIVTIVFELVRALNTLPEGVQFFQNYPTSSLSQMTYLFYVVMIIGPLLILILVLGNRRELAGL